MYFVLELQGFDCHLYHAAQVKALPGRPKTDRADSAWLARITERGSLPSSFVPPEPVRRLRTHTRYRRHLTQARTAEKQRVEKLLEDGHLKLSSVISDIHGVSGRAMLEAIIAGERNPQVLAQLARGTMRGKITRLEEALDCSFLTEEHVCILKMMLAAPAKGPAVLGSRGRRSFQGKACQHAVSGLCYQPFSSAPDIAAQDVTALRGPTAPTTGRYLLAGMLVCGPPYFRWVDGA